MGSNTRELKKVSLLAVNIPAASRKGVELCRPQDAVNRRKSSNGRPDRMRRALPGSAGQQNPGLIDYLECLEGIRCRSSSGLRRSWPSGRSAIGHELVRPAVSILPAVVLLRGKVSKENAFADDHAKTFEIKG